MPENMVPFIAAVVVMVVIGVVLKKSFSKSHTTVIEQRPGSGRDGVKGNEQ
jgi:hypothetical protein